MTPVRKIIHIDMDAFYASVEQRNHPEFRGRPVVVGGRPDSRGVVSTCSYEARRYGIHSAMSTAEAYRRCPHAVFVCNPDFDEYRRVSEQIHTIFHSVTDLVEPLSLDEAYLDVTENSMGEVSATRLAEWIRAQIFESVSLTASAGVSCNKALAKIASDWNKPNGLTVIPPESAGDFLTSLPVTKIWGVGPVTAKRMNALGIHTGGDLRSWPLWKLADVFGKAGPWFYDFCRGKDERPVNSSRVRKSIGKERTFKTDVTDIDRLGRFLEQLCRDVWHETVLKHKKGRTVTVKVKYADFKQVTRSHSFVQPLCSVQLFSETADRLLKETDAGSRPVRLAGVSVSGFVKNESNQLQLEFEEHKKPETQNLLI